MKEVAIFTDASYCPETHIAAYGGWFQTKNGGSYVSGRVVDPIDQNDSQIAAILCVLESAMEDPFLRPGDTVVVHSDSQPALAALMMMVHGAIHREGSAPMNAAKRLKPHMKVAAGRVADFLSAEDLHLIVVHIRGHEGVQADASVIERTCDHIARTTLRILRRQQKEHAA